jgi:GxxExxY protein
VLPGWGDIFIRPSGQQHLTRCADTQDMNRQAAKNVRLQEPDAEVDAWAPIVVQAAIEVHHPLGPGFLESVYEEALGVELSLREVPFQQQVPLAVEYKSRRVGQARLDLLVAGRLVVELKAVDSLLPIHVAQVISYLKTTRHSLGLLINFNLPFLQRGLKRIILTQ